MLRSVSCNLKATYAKKSFNAGVAGHAHQHWGPDFTARAIFVRSLALIMLLSSVAMALYATYNFRLRSSMLQ